MSTISSSHSPPSSFEQMRSMFSIARAESAPSPATNSVSMSRSSATRSPVPRLRVLLPLPSRPDQHAVGTYHHVQEIHTHVCKQELAHLVRVAHPARLQHEERTIALPVGLEVTDL